jgi:hypothetical protein
MAKKVIKATMQVEIPEDNYKKFLLFVYTFSDFMDYLGGWASKVSSDKKLGFLIVEKGVDPDVDDKRQAVKAWREGKPLPKSWHAISSETCRKAYLEGISPSCAVDSEQMMYSMRFSLVFWGVGGIGFHYKTWSGLKRSGIFRPRAARMRLASP